MVSKGLAYRLWMALGVWSMTAGIMSGYGSGATIVVAFNVLVCRSFTKSRGSHEILFFIRFFSKQQFAYLN